MDPILVPIETGTTSDHPIFGLKQEAFYSNLIKYVKDKTKGDDRVLSPGRWAFHDFLQRRVDLRKYYNKAKNVCTKVMEEGDLYVHLVEDEASDEGNGYSAYMDYGACATSSRAKRESRLTSCFCCIQILMI